MATTLWCVPSACAVTREDFRQPASPPPLDAVCVGDGPASVPLVALAATVVQGGVAVARRTLPGVGPSYSRARHTPPLA